ncbi:MAG: hypothetical protein HN736_05365 [Anaerolineae bacterium]|jgi:hypothetical protein|nr:hypothetical protein [Anaerolineae bacterium]MBT3712083.1 hypothetical protein [Anaerolineae bacterium]MBT4312583.1 hypothetical protein [Anaerolineae bacterium]MBT4457706.1 hypothetical protein [Anaerolineae bacterium]MBT6062392.1 hypothetical protein [Anaerolineae bacterium]
MKIKKLLSVTIRIVAVILAMLFSFIIASGIANPQASAQSASQTPEEAAQVGIALLVVSIINALLLAIPIIHSRWHGLKLMGAIALVFFGTQTFMSQIETLFFESAFDIPGEVMKRIILSGFLTALFFAPLAVLILGKVQKSNLDEKPSPSIALSLRGWGIRLTVLPFVYIALYFLFGYYIAWQSPDVRMLYSGTTEMLSFYEQMRVTFQNSPGIIPFQLLRGLVWIGLALPILRLMKGSVFVKSLTIGLLFGLLLTTQLLFPNPYMQEPVRLAHFIETSTSTFLYGWLIGQVFTSPKE